MEPEQIIKALGEEIKLADYVGNGVKTTLFKNTIALIKELAEENETLTIKCNAWHLAAERVGEEIQVIKADTVREMQERIKKSLAESYGTLPHTNCFYAVIDRIANEILNKNTEE